MNRVGLAPSLGIWWLHPSVHHGGSRMEPIPRSHKSFTMRSCLWEPQNATLISVSLPPLMTGAHSQDFMDLMSMCDAHSLFWKQIKYKQQICEKECHTNFQSFPSKLCEIIFLKKCYFFIFPPFWTQYKQIESVMIIFKPRGLCDRAGRRTLPEPPWPD